MPSTAFNPQPPLETFLPTQALDILFITNAQPAALDSAAAAFIQLVYAAAASYGVTLGAPPAQDSLGIEQVNAVIVSADLAPTDAGAIAGVGSASPPITGPLVITRCSK